jgi:tetratricopeptide (TPR) repeat protein
MGTNPAVLMSLNQQWFAATNFEQQAMAFEQVGNLLAAASCWEQATTCVNGAMMYANQWMVPIPQTVYFTLGTYHYHAARVKAMMGRADQVGWHLAMALDSVQRALALNPSYGPYHSFAGTVLLCQGNYGGAIWELQEAVRLNPNDGWSQWMLASVYQAMGKAAMMNPYYNAALQFRPNLMNLPPMPGPGGGAGHDLNSTLGTIKSVLDVVNSLFQVGSNFAGLF